MIRSTFHQCLVASALFLIASTTVAVPLQQKANTDGDRKDKGTKHVQSEATKEFRKTAIPVTFDSDGHTLHGWVYKPAGDGPFPAIVWNHGSEKNPTAHPELGRFYTQHGMAVFLPVRHGHGASKGTYIQDALESYRADHPDPTDIRKKIVDLHGDYNRDVVAAIAWFKKQPYVKTDRLAVSGCSYGGIQTMLTAEKDVGARAFIPFAPAAMSWANTDLRDRLVQAVRNAKAPLFLIQAKNDYNIGPSEMLGPLITAKGGYNRAKVYPAFGTTPQEGHGGFACWDEGIAIWGNDVLTFLRDTGVLSKP